MWTVLTLRPPDFVFYRTLYGWEDPRAAYGPELDPLILKGKIYGKELGAEHRHT